MVKWLKAFPVPEESPAHYVRDLRFALGWSCGTPEEFFNRTPWFTNLEKITVLGDGEFRSFGIPLSARLPQSVTSLTIHTSTVDLVQVWDIMMRLPNLDDLSLSGFGVAIYEGPLPGSGTALRGRFRGQLRLSDRHINEGLVNMLLEVPTGLHFTEVYFLPMCESLSSAVRLTKACGKTLVKLSYVSSIHDDHKSSERSFEFSKFPNYQQVEFEPYGAHDGLHWIPIALSTLRPTTSPRLSSINLSFNGYISRAAKLENLSNNLRRIVVEFARIEHEYDGTVDLTVLRTAGFERLDTLNVLGDWDH